MTLEDERQYASLIGSMVEPVILGTMDHHTRIPPITPEFLQSYIKLVRQAENTLLLKTRRSTRDVLDLYEQNEWLRCQSENIPPELMSKGILRLPQNPDLAYILTQIDRYILPFYNGSFLGAFQSDTITGLGKPMHPFGRFFINGLLVAAREIISHAENFTDLSSHLGRFDRMLIHPQYMAGKEQIIHPNIRFRNGGSGYMLQLDAVVTEESSTYAERPITRIGERGLDPMILINNEIPWDMVNIKLLGDSSSITGRRNISKARSVDIQQLYGQLSKLIYNLWAVKENRERIHLNLPRKAVFVYPRPCRPVSIVELALNSSFYSDFWNHLESQIALGRIAEEFVQPLIEVELYVGVMSVRDIPLPPHAHFPSIMEDSDSNTSRNDWERIFASTGTGPTEKKSIFPDESGVWDTALRERKAVERLVQNSRRSKKKR